MIRDARFLSMSLCCIIEENGWFFKRSVTYINNRKIIVSVFRARSARKTDTNPEIKTIAAHCNTSMSYCRGKVGANNLSFYVTFRVWRILQLSRRYVTPKPKINGRDSGKIGDFPKNARLHNRHLVWRSLGLSLPFEVSFQAVVPIASRSYWHRRRLYTMQWMC